eukprot:GHVT01022911.1.p2 GENE.GHVT01022911.1~~GHVT01022911.1.p2  ORF type:complete len:119 (-),score=9.56 GHVT01022911.1:804-1160(-)
MIGRAGSCDGRFRSDRGAGTTTPRPGIESLAAPTDSMATLLGSSLAPEAQSRLDQLETMLIGAASGSATVVCVFSDAVTHVIMPCTSSESIDRYVHSTTTVDRPLVNSMWTNYNKNQI